MCGFVGIVAGNLPNSDSYINKINSKILNISHRGPDGIKTHADKDLIVSHAILSIQGDSIKQNQPFCNERYVMAFNGEILNFNFAKSLIKKNYKFFDDDKSDTPILFAGLIEQGIDFLKNIDGFYTVFFYDKKLRKGFIARDPSGQKQLYYRFNKTEIEFASEIKALDISGDLNPLSVNTYKIIGYVPSPNTIYKDIKALRCGEVINFSLSVNNLCVEFNSERLFHLDSSENKFKASELKSVLSEKIKRNVVTNKKVAILLSGGVDSSIVLNEAIKFADVEAYTISYDLPIKKKRLKYNVDVEYAKSLCKQKNIRHHTVTIKWDRETLISSIDHALTHLDQPHSIGNIISQFELAKFIKKESPETKVIINGNGADEIFLGYESYRLQAKINILKKFKYLIANKYVLKIFSRFFVKYSFYLRYFLSLKFNHSAHLCTWMQNDFFAVGNNNSLREMNKKLDLLSKVFEESFENVSFPENKFLYGVNDLMTWISDDANVQSDRSFSSVGIESRSPFIPSLLYQDLVKFFDYSKVGKVPKEILIDAYSSDFTPDFLKRKKWGWVSPILYWLKIIGDELIKEAIDAKLTKKYFPEIKKTNFEQIKLTERWKILIFWRWCVVNQYT